MTESDIAISRYRMRLKQIAEHPFVTDYSRECRRQMREQVELVKSAVGKYGDVEVAGFAYGSVGVGLAREWWEQGLAIEEGDRSDIDGVIFFKCENGVYQKARWDLSSIYPLSDVHIRDFRLSMNLSDLAYWITGGELSGAMLRTLAHVFLPSLSEAMDVNEQIVVDGWRREVLGVMSKLEPVRARGIWDEIRGMIKNGMVLYGSRGGFTVDCTKDRYRKMRVYKRIGDTLKERFDGDMSRAWRMIHSWRHCFEYPEFEEMCNAYGWVCWEPGIVDF